jgi:hypothetical protein
MRGMTISTGEADSETMSHFPMNATYELPFLITFLYNDEKQTRKVYNSG